MTTKVIPPAQGQPIRVVAGGLGDGKRDSGQPGGQNGVFASKPRQSPSPQVLGVVFETSA